MKGENNERPKHLPPKLVLPSASFRPPVQPNGGPLLAERLLSMHLKQQKIKLLGTSKNSRLQTQEINNDWLPNRLQNLQARLSSRATFRIFKLTFQLLVLAFDSCLPQRKISENKNSTCEKTIRSYQNFYPLWPISFASFASVLSARIVCK